MLKEILETVKLISEVATVVSTVSDALGITEKDKNTLQQPVVVQQLPAVQQPYYAQYNPAFDPKIMMDQINQIAQNQQTLAQRQENAEKAIMTTAQALTKIASCNNSNSFADPGHQYALKKLVDTGERFKVF